ncbi:pullulanase [Streptococcus didelphis]|uniref:pullulanase n=1 Tax=Streptococcus didelphis TaxID=102886 RepID=UPI0003808CEB|nr:pullulanase [Streptococcus didelphis]
MHQVILKKQATQLAEKRQVFAIRRLKLGVASVTIASSLLFLGARVAADELAEVSVPRIVKSDLRDSIIAEQVGQTESLQDLGALEIAAPVDSDEAKQEKELSGDVSQVGLDKPSPEGTLSLESAKQLVAGQTAPVSEAPLKEAILPKADQPIESGFIRMHYQKLPSEDLASIGLWTWEDVATPSGKNGAWPQGATSFSQAKADDYGLYLDIKMSEGPRNMIKWLINNSKGENLTGDKSLDILSQTIKEVWFDQNYKTYYYQPQKAGTVRINYFRTDGNYDDKALWIWGNVDKSVSSQLKTWPDGLSFKKGGDYGAYLDVALSDLPNEIGFILLDKSKSGDAVKIRQEDYKFTNLKNHSQIFLRDDDASVYTNPFFVNTVRILGAQQISPHRIQASLTSFEGLDKPSLLKDLKVTAKTSASISITDILLQPESKTILISGDFSAADGPYQVTYKSDTFTASSNWQYKDALYAYDGPLGARLSENGQEVDVTLWSPSAEKVDLIIYDKTDQDHVLAKAAMTKGDKGEWSIKLNQGSHLGITDYSGYYYHFDIIRDGKSHLVLDPYAKSLAAWNSELADKGPAYALAKAAFVNPSQLGPKDLTYANIQNFKNREDAIIYEAHVRDFTSDTAISGELKNHFGTFSAFTERLDYLQSLGVTHIQLLPVMSYYFVNEMNKEVSNNYSSSGNNYNWGYDPQSYFALTGMYASDPADPSKRIIEFKNLVNEIHKRGMGIILDVVYNHTAKLSLFEDLEPNYYHFMDADGSPRSSFGGGRLGTTHYMSRRVLVDSIKYLVSEFKVDGFRFDMMGDHDAESIETAYKAAKALNPNIIMLGEGWVTYAGDENMPQEPADQKWMSKTDTVASFSDDIRNMLKSGFGNEGQPAFITGGKKDIYGLFNNIKAQPNNFTADDPGDVIQYIAAHDNLSLFDIIAQSIKKDPAKADNNAEIHRRLRLGNLLILTSQGTPFIHSGQEYGRSKQFRDPAYKGIVPSDKVPNKSHLLVNEDGSPFEYPYFIHDSYDSTDAINHFDWKKATDAKAYPENVKSQAYTKGLIALRRSSDAFRLSSKVLVDENVKLLTIPGQNGLGQVDVIIAYELRATNGDRYLVLVNADNKTRHFNLDKEWLKGQVLVDADRAGLVSLVNPVGISYADNGISLTGLTAAVLKLAADVAEQKNTSEDADKENLGLVKDMVKGANHTHTLIGAAKQTMSPNSLSQELLANSQKEDKKEDKDQSQFGKDREDGAKKKSSKQEANFKSQAEARDNDDKQKSGLKMLLSTLLGAVLGGLLGLVVYSYFKKGK